MSGAGLSSQLDKWTIIGSWRLSPAPGPGVAGGAAGALGCLPSGSQSSALGQPAGMPALALPVTSHVPWAWYLSASLCSLQKSELTPGLPQRGGREESRVVLSS